MPTNIQATLTDVGRAMLISAWGQQTSFEEINMFGVGEGGWRETPSGRVPRDPTDPGPSNNRGPVLSDLDSQENPSDYPVDSRGAFYKALVSGDLTFTDLGDGDLKLEAECFLDFGEFNDDGNGNFPEMYEIGLFNDKGAMVAYGTFPLVKKDPSVSRTFTVRILSGR